LTDAVALGLAWFATRLSGLPPNKSNTFGYRRSGILVALVNAVILIVVALVVAVEAILRLQHPERVAGGTVIAAAVGAIAVNAYIAFALRQHEEDNMNVHAALLHVLGDIAASIGVIVAGVAVLLWHTDWVDPVISLFIGALISFGAWQIVRDTVTILMEGTPRGIDLDKVEAAMLEVPGVEDVHDLHVWSLSDGFRLLSAHVTAPDQSLSDASNLLTDVKIVLHRRFHIDHATIEVECVDCRVPQRRAIELYVPGSTPGAPGNASQQLSRPHRQ
jgi:cobalt-zinc-cadmium efflux system protein